MQHLFNNLYCNFRTKFALDTLNEFDSLLNVTPFWIWPPSEFDPLT